MRASPANVICRCSARYATLVIAADANDRMAIYQAPADHTGMSRPLLKLNGGSVESLRDVRH